MASQISGYIGKLNPGNGTEYSLGSTAYGICSTAAGTVAKTVDMTGFTLITGATIFVKFTNANSATNPTLNVNSTGAKALLKYGSSSLNWQAGAVLCLTYDGTSWIGNSVTLQDLGLSNAMHFIGKATVAVTDGGTENPTITGYDFTNDRKPGDVIIDKDNGREYVWTIAGAWEILGRDASTTFDSGAAQTNKWISRLEQDSAGNLTATIGTLDTSGTWSGNAATADKVNKNLIIKINTGSTEGTSLYTFNGSAAKTLDIKAGTGISFGTLAAGILTIGHSNSVTAKTAYGSTATTASADGGTIKVTDVKYDAQGHITASTDRTITLSQVKNTAGSTNTSSKIYLIGATEQAANPQTYSDDEVFAENGELSVRKLKITSTAGIKHIEFSRAGYNYIWAPDSGSVAIGANSTVSIANSTMIATATTLYPGTDSTISLGIANNHWKDSFFDTIYVSSNTGYTSSTSAQNGITISGAGWIDMTSENTSTLPHIDFKIAKSTLDYQVRLDSNSPGRLRVLRDTTNVTTSKADPNKAANLTYNSRGIDPIFHVVGKTYVNGDAEASGYFLTNTASNGGGGYYLYGNNAQYALLYINKIGTAGTYTPGEEGAAATTTNGTLGEVYLTLGNATPQTPTDASHLGANNARGRIRLYGSAGNYTDIISQPNGDRIFYLPQFAGTMYAIHAGNNNAIGTATKPVYIAANGRATVGTYELKSTVDSGTANRMAYYSGNNAISASANIATDGSYLDPVTTNTGHLGSASVSWTDAYIVHINARHLDAAPTAINSDSALYIGWGAKQATKATKIFYSANTTARTQFFEVNSNGSYALTRFGVNGQSTSYTLYVNGTTYLGGNTTLEGNSTLSRAGKSINWNQANTYAMLRMTTQAGWSPMLALKANTGWWTMGHYNASGYNDQLLFGFLADVDVSGVTNAKNHLDYTVRLIPTVYATNTTTITDRAFVTSGYASSSAAKGSATVPVYVDASGVVQTITSYSGNAATATKLATARSINGTNFDGSANITTANWGTARTLTIGATGKSVNGSANVSWSIGEIVGSTAIGGTAKPIYWTGSAFSAISATAGSAALPVYLNAGTITACTASSVFSALSWTAGTTAGPTLNATIAGQARTATIPTATASASGIVTTGAQTWAGAKTLSGGMLAPWIELNSATPYIDFHHGSSTADFTSRLITTANGILQLGGPASTNISLCIRSSTSGNWSYLRIHNNSQYWDIGSNSSTQGSIPAGALKFGYNGANDGVWITTGKVLMGAAWNDYAEFRKVKDKEKVEPGRCVKEIGDGTLEMSTERLQRGCEIVSDTFGFVIGPKDNDMAPTAATGRVLAYPYESREEFAQHIGWPVCSGPNGTVSIMTEEEEEKYPSRIIGTISEIPTYNIWHGGEDIEVNGRVWIRIR